MGNGARYSEFEFTVVTLHDHGVLKPEIVDALAERHRGTDIDSGGSEGHRAKDGKDLVEIVVSLLEPAKYEKIAKKRGNARWEALDELWSDIRAERWGWL